MASPFDARLQSILKGYVTPLLKDQGFVRKGGVYYRALDELTWLVEIERSSLNDPTQSTFTVTCGVFVPGLVSIYVPVQEPSRPKYPHCALFARLGLLSEANMDVWWDLTATDTPSADIDIGLDIRRRLVKDGLPFLDRFHTRREVLDFLLAPRRECDRGIWPPSSRLHPEHDGIRLMYTAILCHILGDQAQSDAILDAAQADAKYGFEKTVAAVRRRIAESGGSGPGP